MIGMVMGIAVLTLLLRCVSQKRVLPKGVLWITPIELAQSFEVGPLTRLKFKLLRLPGPFWDWYMHGREQILIETRVLTLPSEIAQQVELPPECQTNQQGIRVWRLSAKELTGMKQQLKALPDVSEGDSMRVTTLDGSQAQGSVGNPLSKTNGSFVGLTVDLLPIVVGHSINLVLGATSTDVSPGGAVLGTTTNLTAAFKALIPNGGGFLMASGMGGDLHQRNFWMIISAVAVDARGIQKGL